MSAMSNLDKMIRDERSKILRLKAMLRSKEQSLIERTKGEITMLEQRKRELKLNGKLSEIPSLKKKQRALLLNLQHERCEMERMKKRYKKTYHERKHILRNHRHLFKLHLDSSYEITKRNSSLGNSRDATRTKSVPLKGMHPKGVVTKKTKMGEDSFSVILSQREKELQQRRSHVEALLRWSQRLDEKEREITHLESRLGLKSHLLETTDHSGNQTHSKQFDKSEIERMEYRLGLKQAPEKSVIQMEPELQQIIRSEDTNLSRLQLASKLQTSEFHIQDNNKINFDRGKTCCADMQTRNNLINQTTGDITQYTQMKSCECKLDPTANRIKVEQMIAKRDMFVQTTPRIAMEIVEPTKKVRGSDLNRLWRHMTGSKKQKYDDRTIYKMSKKHLDEFFEEAKAVAVHDFSENDDTLVNVFHNSSTDSTNQQLVLSDNLHTYNSHKDRRNDLVDHGLTNYKNSQKVSGLRPKFATSNSGTSDLMAAFDDLSELLRRRKHHNVSTDVASTVRNVSGGTDDQEKITKVHGVEVVRTSDSSQNGKISRLVSTHSVVMTSVYSDAFTNERPSDDDDITTRKSNDRQSSIKVADHNSVANNNEVNRQNTLRSSEEVILSEHANKSIINGTLNTGSEINTIPSLDQENTASSEVIPSEIVKIETNSPSESLIEEIMDFKVDEEESVQEIMEHSVQESEEQTEHNSINTSKESEIKSICEEQSNEHNVESSNVEELISGQELTSEAPDSIIEDVEDTAKSVSVNRRSQKSDSAPIEIIEMASECEKNSLENSHTPSRKSHTYSHSTNSYKSEIRNNDKSIEAVDEEIYSESHEKSSTDDQKPAPSSTEDGLKTESLHTPEDPLSDRKDIASVPDEVSLNTLEAVLKSDYVSKFSEETINTVDKIYETNESVIRSDNSITASNNSARSGQSVGVNPDGSADDTMKNQDNTLEEQKKGDPIVEDLPSNQHSDSTSAVETLKSSNVYDSKESTTASGSQKSFEKANSKKSLSNFAVSGLSITEPKSLAEELRNLFLTSPRSLLGSLTSDDHLLRNVRNENTPTKLLNDADLKKSVENTEHIGKQQEDIFLQDFSKSPEELVSAREYSKLSQESTISQSSFGIMNIFHSKQSSIIGSPHESNAIDTSATINDSKTEKRRPAEKSDLEKRLVKIDDGLKDLSETFERVPVLEKSPSPRSESPRTLQEYASDFDSNVYTSSGSDSSSARKAQKSPLRTVEIIERNDLPLGTNKLESDGGMIEPNSMQEAHKLQEKLDEFDRRTDASIKYRRYENGEPHLAPIEKRLWNNDLDKKDEVIDLISFSPPNNNHKTHSPEGMKQSESPIRSSAAQTKVPKNLSRSFENVDIFTKIESNEEVQKTLLDSMDELSNDIKFHGKTMNLLSKPRDGTSISPKVTHELSTSDNTLNEDEDIPEEIFWYEDTNHQNTIDSKDTFLVQSPSGTVIEEMKSPCVTGDQLVESHKISPPQTDRSDVRRRVQEILAKSSGKCCITNSNTSEAGSPRLQDLWVTTNECLTPSPVNSPPVSPSIHLGAEAEELRRKQFEIELEIKRLQQQQENEQIEFYVREIPNKPPPPYTPPVAEILEKTYVKTDSPNVSLTEREPPRRLTKDETDHYISEHTRILYDAFLNGQLNTLEYKSVIRNDDQSISEKLVFDLCKEVIIEHFRYTSDTPVWLQGKRIVPRNVYYRLDDLTEHVRTKVMQFMNFKCAKSIKLSNISKTHEKKSQSNSREVQMERRDWKNRDRDFDLMCKENATSCLMNLLLTETAEAVDRSFRRKYGTKKS